MVVSATFVLAARGDGRRRSRGSTRGISSTVTRSSRCSWVSWLGNMGAKWKNVFSIRW